MIKRLKYTYLFRYMYYIKSLGILIIIDNVNYQTSIQTEGDLSKPYDAQESCRQKNDTWGHEENRYTRQQRITAIIRP